jgi:hypothetical protein
LDRPGHYYAIFGIDKGGTNNIDLRAETAAIVTMVPRGKEGQVVLVPEGKQIARSKLLMPARTPGDQSDRNLFYRVGDGQARFVSPKDAKKSPISR